jgi:hypothetical protein
VSLKVVQVYGMLTFQYPGQRFCYTLKTFPIGYNLPTNYLCLLAWKRNPQVLSLSMQPSNWTSSQSNKLQNIPMSLPVGFTCGKQGAFILNFRPRLFIRRSYRPRDVREHEMFSTAQGFGSWVRIPLETWMSAFVLSCIGSGLASG